MIFCKLAPPVWLEQTTLRLTAACSTDWAKEEYRSLAQSVCRHERRRNIQNGLEWTVRFLLCWHRSIFPGRLQPSIFDAGELNFCVRYGYRCVLTAISTNYSLEYHIYSSLSIRYPQNWTKILRSFCWDHFRYGQALDRLVLPSLTPHDAYTLSLSTL